MTNDASRPTPHILGSSAAIKNMLDTARRAARSEAAVLIEGETGTGKDLLAAAIQQHSARRRAAFVKVNCAAIRDELLESELFGHERGAFPGAYRPRAGGFEQADHGTLFLDEVGDMSPPIQAKVLRALQAGEYERLGGTRTFRCDVRVVAATNRDIVQMMAEHRFRQDLFYRLGIIRIAVPPLRARKEDIPEMARYFLQRSAREAHREVDDLEPAATARLLRHDWPGNVRELENVIYRAVVMSSARVLPASALEVEPLAFDDLPAWRAVSARPKARPAVH